MNLKDRLNHIAHMLGASRRYGKTTLIAKACKDVDGILLCASHDQARAIRREHEVHTESIDKNLQGLRGPFFIDHFAVERLLQRASDKIENLEEEIRGLQNEKQNLEYDVIDLINKERV